jgi:hypothetical protein
MRQPFLVSIAFACLVAPASADPCKQSYDAWSAYIDIVDRFGHDAVEAALTCAMRGPNDALSDTLKTRYLKVFSLAAVPSSPPASCIKNTIPELAVMAEIAGRAAGERFGIAFRQCTTKVQQRIAELRRKGVKDEDIGAEVGTLIQPIIDQLGK